MPRRHYRNSNKPFQHVRHDRHWLYSMVPTPSDDSNIRHGANVQQRRKAESCKRSRSEDLLWHQQSVWAWGLSCRVVRQQVLLEVAWAHWPFILLPLLQGGELCLRWRRWSHQQDPPGSPARGPTGKWLYWDAFSRQGNTKGRSVLENNSYCTRGQESRTSNW